MREKQGKSSRRIGWIVLGAVAVVLICAGVYLADHFAVLLGKKLDDRLPTIEQKLGVAVSYRELSINPTSRLTLTGFTLDDPDHPGTPFLAAEEATVVYSLYLHSSPRVQLRKLVLTAPEFRLGLTADKELTLPHALTDRLKRMLRSGDDAAGEGGGLPDDLPIDIPETIEIEIENGGAVLTEGYFSDAEKPVTIRLEKIDGTLQITPGQKNARLQASGYVSDGNGAFDVDCRIDRKQADLKLTGRKVALADLQPYAPDFLTLKNAVWDDGVVSVKFPFHESEKRATFQVAASGFEMMHRRFSFEPIRDIAFEAEGDVVADHEHKKYRLENAVIGRNGAQVRVSFDGDFNDPWHIKGRLFAKEMPIQEGLDALPADFIPVLQGANVAGTVTFEIPIEIAWKNLRNLVFDPRVEVRDFMVITPPPKADVSKLKHSFEHTAYKKGKKMQTFIVGPENEYYTPFSEIGTAIRKGVLTCEDGRFFSHSGFQLKHIRQSIIENLKRKRFFRGGSTISMQTTKNLFLSGEKNFSRKFQEMLLTYYMEQTLSKERIFEIYMNIIEWGPNLYGIGRASRHYFGKSPSGLTYLEGAFLGSIIANPVRYHAYYDRGDVSDTWADYLSLIMSKMHLPYEDYEEAAPYRPEFYWVKKKRLEKEKLEKEAKSKDDFDDEIPAKNLQDLTDQNGNDDVDPPKSKKPPTDFNDFLEEGL